MPTYNVGNSSTQTCAATVKTTVLQVEAPASRCAELADFSVGGYSIDPAATTGQVYVYRKLAADKGTGATTALVQGRQKYTPAALFAAKETFTVEGTSGNWELVAGPFPLSPVSTLFAWQFAPGDEPECKVSDALAIVCEFPSSQTVRASMTIRE